MPPPAVDYFSYRGQDNGYDSEFIPVQEPERFPSKYVDDEEPEHSQHFSLSGHPQHYADSEPPTRNTSRTRTTSSAKRSRKTSSSTASALVKALLNDKLDSEANSHAQLVHAYDVLRLESKRAADAERIALESAERLKGFAVARAAAQQDAARAQAELREYKLQLEHANRRLEDANALAAASDADRVRAERAMGRMKRTVERFREGELARRAKEQGWKEGRREVLRSVAAQIQSNGRGPGLDHDMSGGPFTPGSNVPLPVPPPASVPTMSRALDTPSSRRSTQTPIQANSQPWGPAPAVPNVVRQATTSPTSTPPRRRVQTPSWPVPPPASTAVPPPGMRDMHDPDFDFDDAIPFPELREQLGDRSTMPDHIIIRSPIPTYAASPPLSEVPPPLPQPASSHRVSQPPRPSSSQRISQSQRPPSSQATRNTHISYPQQHSSQSRHTRHASIDVPARMGSASANRIYSHYETSSETSSSDPIRPPRVSREAHGHGNGHRRNLPQQETIVPRPASATNPRFTPPNRTPSVSGSIPASAAAFHRQRLRRNSTASSSTTTSSGRTEATFPAPSRIAQLRRQGMGDRRHSVESNNSVPDITIQPPSRPESTDTVATGITLPSHLTPFGNPDLELDDDDDIPPPAWGATPQMEPQRPPSRTGFMYGPPHSPTGGSGGLPAHGVSGAMGFGHPPPAVNFGAPPPGYPRPPSSASSRPRHMSMSEAPPRPGSAADYFSGDHHRGKHRSGHEHGNGHGHGHRREAAGMGASVDTLTMLDPNSFHDPDTDPSLLDEDELGREGAATPRASAGGYGFDDRRGNATPTSSHKSAGFIPPRPSSGTGFGPPRPPSRSPAQTYDEGVFDSPRRVPLPTSSHTSAYPSRAGSAAPSSGGGGGRSRKVSLLSGGISGRKGDEGGGTRSTSRNAFGNTPFVWSNGLYDD